MREPNGTDKPTKSHQSYSGRWQRVVATEPVTLSDFKSYWPFLRKYQTSHQSFADLSRLVYCMEHGLKFEWLKAWEAHRAKDWPEPPLDAQMRCLEHKLVFDSLIRDRVYEETM